MDTKELQDQATVWLSKVDEKAEHNQYWYSAPTIAAMLAGFREIIGSESNSQPSESLSSNIDATSTTDSSSSTSNSSSTESSTTTSTIPPIIKRAAFLSTPSLYFSLPANERYQKLSTSSATDTNDSTTNLNAHIVFDYDSVAFGKDVGFCFYDFHQPENIPVQYHHQFDLVIIDPPFITEEVWKAYAITSNLLLRDSTKGHVLGTTVAENLQFLQTFFPQPLIHRNKFQPSIPHLVYQYDLYTTWDSPTFSKSNPEIPE